MSPRSAYPDVRLIRTVWSPTDEQPDRTAVFYMGTLVGHCWPKREGRDDILVTDRTEADVFYSIQGAAARLAQLHIERAGA